MERLAQVVVEQVDVGVEREAGRVVAEPALHLHDIPAFREQARCDGVAKRMEAGPLDAGCLQAGASTLMARLSGSRTVPVAV